MTLSTNWMISDWISWTGNHEMLLTELQDGLDRYVVVAGEMFVSWQGLWRGGPINL